MSNLIEYMVIRVMSLSLTSLDPKSANIGHILLGIAMMMFSIWLLRRGSKMERWGMILFSILTLLARDGY